MQALRPRNRSKRNDLLSIETEAVFVERLLDALDPVHLTHAVEQLLVFVTDERMDAGCDPSLSP